jgi:lysophospholipase L1-like esterase
VRAPQHRVRLAVLGDSIAYGLGASRPQDTLAARLSHVVAERGFDVACEVFAASGARSADLPPQVDRAVAWPSDVAVLVIGANDLTHLVPVAEAVADLADAVRRLRAAGGEVVLAPAPDLSAVPRVPAQLRAAVQQASHDLRSAQLEVAVPLGARIADADGDTTRSFAADRSLFSADRFHPSSAGYAAIAAALLPATLAACQAVARTAPDRSARTPR